MCRTGRIWSGRSRSRGRSSARGTPNCSRSGSRPSRSRPGSRCTSKISTARIIITSSNPASRGWHARCARRSRSTRAAPARSPRPKAPSAAEALERAAAESGVADNIIVTSRPEEVALADRIVLPGVGAFADCRRGLAAVPGLEDALVEAVIGRGRPFLGICVGMQLMAERGREFETVEGLGWIPGEVVAIAPINSPGDPCLKIPHMGWNELSPCAAHPVLDGLPAGTHAYFVHSFELRPADHSDLL